ncbi:MAG: hypothetical protein K2M06_05810 [Muribaculaceae bacterium]|nr:hypothetical protein [Muribaculaceae bacterium]
MKKLYYFSMIAGILLASCSEDSPKNEEPAVPEGPEVPATMNYVDAKPLEVLEHWTSMAGEKASLDALTDFSYTLNAAVAENYEALWAGDETGNYSLSPLSVSFFLSLMSECTDGSGHRDLCKMLGVAEAELPAITNKLLRYLPKEKDGLRMDIANSFWNNKGFGVQDAFRKRVEEMYGAPTNELDLFSPSCVEVLNGWCGDKTHGMIKEVFSEAPRAQLVIGNALYFAGSWAYPFDKANTMKELFRGTAGTSEVEMLRYPSYRWEYAKVDGVEYTTLPFVDGFEMAIVVPPAQTDMKAFAKRIDKEYLMALAEAGEVKDIDFSMPKFEDAHQGMINDVLRELGFPEYEMSVYPLTGVSGSSLSASAVPVIHSTKISVDEDGAKLAAITIGGMVSSPGAPEEVERVVMKVDRPFYYIVRNTECGSIVMTGRVCNL